MELFLIYFALTKWEVINKGEKCVVRQIENKEILSLCVMRLGKFINYKIKISYMSQNICAIKMYISMKY